MTLLSRAPATTELYTLSLHDALPIFEHRRLLGPGGLPLGDGLAEELGVGLDDVEIQAANLGLLIGVHLLEAGQHVLDRKSTRLNSSHVRISYAVFCLKKKTIHAFPQH